MSIPSAKLWEQVMNWKYENVEEIWIHNNDNRMMQQSRERQGEEERCLFVDFNAYGTLGDVPDLAGAAMIELVGHALVNGAVHLDIHVIPNLVGSEINCERDVTLLPEWTSKQIPRPTSKPVTCRHLLLPPCSPKPYPQFLPLSLYIPVPPKKHTHDARVTFKSWAQFLLKLAHFHHSHLGFSPSHNSSQLDAKMATTLMLCLVQENLREIIRERK